MRDLSIFFVWLLLQERQLISTSSSRDCPTNCTCTTTTSLDCSYKRLTEFPLLTISFIKIDLDSNHISHVPKNAFVNMTMLHVLWLNNNNLASIPLGIFDNLYQLNTLHLEKNTLKSLPPKLFKDLHNLKILHMHTNHLKTLPSGTFDGLTSLETISLYNNRWHCSCSGTVELGLWLDNNSNIVRGLSGAGDVIPCSDGQTTLRKLTSTYINPDECQAAISATTSSGVFTLSAADREIRNVSGSGTRATGTASSIFVIMAVLCSQNLF